MIYDLPKADDSLDQGDIIDACPLAQVVTMPDDPKQTSRGSVSQSRVIVLTQTCDLAQDKTPFVNVAEVYDAQNLVDNGILKPTDIKGPLRAGRVWGWYFLPADAALALPEMIVDFRRLYTLPLALLRGLCQGGQRRGRVRILYREHLAKHFADTFSRIGLPRPYETL